MPEAFHKTEHYIKMVEAIAGIFGILISELPRARRPHALQALIDLDQQYLPDDPSLDGPEYWDSPDYAASRVATESFLKAVTILSEKGELG